MSPHLSRPLVLLASLAAASAVLGSTFVGNNYGAAPSPGLYLVLTGLWFGLVIGFAAWRWAERTVSAFATAFVITWIGWEAAVNVAVQIDGPALEGTVIPYGVRLYLAGFAAGALGALITWAGVAIYAQPLRRRAVVAAVVATGALFGLLLPATNTFDSGLVLLVPWQVAIALVIGANLVQETARPRDPRALARPGSTGSRVTSLDYGVSQCWQQSPNA